MVLPLLHALQESAWSPWQPWKWVLSHTWLLWMSAARLSGLSLGRKAWTLGTLWSLLPPQHFALRERCAYQSCTSFFQAPCRVYHVWYTHTHTHTTVLQLMQYCKHKSKLCISGCTMAMNTSQTPTVRGILRIKTKAPLKHNITGKQNFHTEC